jgi:hypothetical protein
MSALFEENRCSPTIEFRFQRVGGIGYTANRILSQYLCRGESVLPDHRRAISWDAVICIVSDQTRTERLRNRDQARELFDHHWDRGARRAEWHRRV